MSLQSKHILVKGDVQGVFYRKHTRQTADDLNLTGWVKNTSDGHVEIFVQGNDEAIEKFIKWCWQGSPKSTVVNVEIKDAEPDHQLQEFIIDR